MSVEPAGPGRRASRRAVVGGVLGVGAGASVLAACGGDSSGGAADSGGSGTDTTSGTVGTTAEVPVGSGTIFAADKVVVTQPTEGEYLAFTAVCTHQQCVVSEVVGQDIDCSCHGSKFSIRDGSVVQGPATEPLTRLDLRVDGEDLVVS